jgi:hypothetical protein
MPFDPTRSPIQQDPEQLAAFLAAIKDALPGESEVVGVVEIGSYAKGEALPGSDTDTRVYIKSCGPLNVVMMSDSEVPTGLVEFVHGRDELTLNRIGYGEFNRAIVERLRDKVDNRPSAGFIDVRFAEFLFADLGKYPTQDHSMLFQSSIVYDPENWIRRQREELDGKVTPGLIEMYLRQVTTRAHEQLPWYAANPDNRRGFHQWLLKAVRTIREAISLRNYTSTGRFLFRKEEVLRWIRCLDSESRQSIEQIYTWKCSLDVRAEVKSSFEKGEDTWRERFAEMTPIIQKIVDDLLLDVYRRA